MGLGAFINQHPGSSELHPIGEEPRSAFMKRLALYASAISATLAACIVIRRRIVASRPVPAKKAAAMLQRAWADNHTVA